MCNRLRSVRHRGEAVIGLSFLVLCFVSGVIPAWAADDQPATAIKRPAYQILRYDEDWSMLKGVDLSRTGDFWDRLKFIPITRDQDIWMSVGGQVRERFEYYGQYFFGSSTPERSDGYLLSRFRLSTDIHVTKYFRVFLEGKSSLATDRELTGGRSNNYVDTIDLQNAFADIVIPFDSKASVTFRGGRQELLFGAQRLVGPSDWGGNVRRTFDGAGAILRYQDWTVTPFWAQLVIVDQHSFNKSTSENKLYGIYSTGNLHFLPVNIDLYWLGVNNRTATFTGVTGRERRHTFGGRLWGKVGQTGLDFEIEGAAQVGQIASRDILASMFTAVVGYSPPVTILSPRVYLEFDYASGGRPGGDVHTFNQLYPTGHSFLGYIDYIGRQNIISPSAGLSVIPLRGLTLSLQQYFFWRDSDRDAIYTKSGAVLRRGDTTTARYVGAETDLYVTYNFDRHLLLYGGYSHFFPGKFIENTGPHRGSDFFYTAAQYTF